ncbi:zf-HC2 domain-containing protein [Myxococcota bacterium]|nr:zf-HC2 domain-containing protein [Myxococcota bacterium]
MDCREAERFVDLSLDGELEPHDRAIFESHLAVCSACHADYRTKSSYLAAVRTKLADADAEARAPLGLRTRIVARVRADERRESGLGWGRAVSATLGVSMIAVLSWNWSGPPLVPEDAVLRHTVNLPPEVRADADDVRLVERFLSKNLRYPVEVPRFASTNPNVRLVGARLSNLDEREAAYVMYDHRGAKISLFAFPKPARFSVPDSFREVQAGHRSVLVGQRRGYNVVAWEDGDVVYSLVSDVDPRELVSLAAMAH